MRRIVMFNRVSADGRFADASGGLGWVVRDEAVDRAGAAGIPRVDTVLFGRRTYQLFEGFWAHALDDAGTAPDPHRAGHRSPEQGAFAAALDAMTKLVFSRTLDEVTWRNSRLVRALDPGAIEAMKREPGRDMIVFGSGSLVVQLAELGLIDEYQLVVTPALLGGGRPLFDGLTRHLRLTLLEATPYPSGNVMLRYGHSG